MSSLDTNISRQLAVSTPEPLLLDSPLITSIDTEFDLDVGLAYASIRVDSSAVVVRFDEFLEVAFLVQTCIYERLSPGTVIRTEDATSNAAFEPHGVAERDAFAKDVLGSNAEWEVVGWEEHHIVQPPLSEAAAMDAMRTAFHPNFISELDFVHRVLCPRLVHLDAVKPTRYCAVYQLQSYNALARYRVYMSWTVESTELSQRSKLLAPSAWSGEAVVLSRVYSAYSTGFASLCCQLPNGDIIIVEFDLSQPRGKVAMQDPKGFDHLLNLVASLAHNLDRKIRARFQIVFLHPPNANQFYWLPTCKIPLGSASPPSHEAKGEVDVAENAGDSPLASTVLPLS
ncbi:hypothetical protein C8J57DRAFT_1220449 [Mycena rebaudengoi]|nr:hypothetical protein C8J57DRAFT_1252040 [Mycena rebaudengoi]KAJ7279912.1 hypothetical protein C8J57DRAFT_1220449 [Mycena rebaudengoi]